MTELEGATKTVESEAAETATAVATDGVGLAAVAIAAAVEGLAVAADVAEEEPPNGAVAAVEAEPEEPTEEMEGSELIDDPVRMYLREIGRVTLLKAADERRLAQQLHSGKHVDKLEKEILDATERPVQAADAVRKLLRRLEGAVGASRSDRRVPGHRRADDPSRAPHQREAQGLD